MDLFTASAGAGLGPLMSTFELRTIASNWLPPAGLPCCQGSITAPQLYYDPQGMLMLNGNWALAEPYYMEPTTRVVCDYTSGQLSEKSEVELTTSEGCPSTTSSEDSFDLAQPSPLKIDPTTSTASSPEHSDDDVFNNDQVPLPLQYCCISFLSQYSYCMMPYPMQLLSFGVPLYQTSGSTSSDGSGNHLDNFDNGCCSTRRVSCEPSLETIPELAENLHAYDYVEKCGPYHKALPLKKLTSRRQRKTKKLCAFCLSNKETAKCFKSHFLHDPSGKVSCPILRQLVCPLCGQTGDDAHTFRYCPWNTSTGDQFPSRRTVYEGSCIGRNATGQRTFVLF